MKPDLKHLKGKTEVECFLFLIEWAKTDVLEQICKRMELMGVTLEDLAKRINLPLKHLKTVFRGEIGLINMVAIAYELGMVVDIRLEKI